MSISAKMSVAALAFTTLVPAGANAESTTMPDKTYAILEQKDVMVQMRDGVKLSTNIYLPSEHAENVLLVGGKTGVSFPMGSTDAAATGRFPAIVQRTPYGKDFRPPWNEMEKFFVPRGYVVIVQDVRGRFGSEGAWDPVRGDGRDGFDLFAWIGKQSWSNGRIGTVGVSYDGAVQHALAIARAPGLAAMIPIDAMSNVGAYGIRHQGAFELRWLNWVFTLGNATGNALTPDGEVTGALRDAHGKPTGQYRLPSGEIGPLEKDPLFKLRVESGPVAAKRAASDPARAPDLIEMGNRVRDYALAAPLKPGATPLKYALDYERWLIEAMNHSDNDRYWKDFGSSVADHLEDFADVPVLHVTGSYDSWGEQVADMNYVLLSKAKKSPQHLLFGPWTHGGQALSHAGFAEFGPDAALDMRAIALRWYARWLKGVANGAEKDPPVRVFVMGGGDGHRTKEGRIFVGGHWRDEQEWPLARTRFTHWYFHSDGALSTDVPAASEPSRYRFDPADPVPTIGGNVSSTGVLMQMGAFDQRCRPALWPCKDSRPLAARKDLRVFESAPLTKDMEITGPLRVELWASSDCPDTDFTAKLIDVWPANADFPEGVALNIGDGIVRARYRDSLEKPALMKPGKVYKFTIVLYPTSLLVKRGHRLRVDISSSNFPRFDVNPNTGEPLNANTQTRVADNAIWHDPAHPSAIVLPVIPH